MSPSPAKILNVEKTATAVTTARQPKTPADIIDAMLAQGPAVHVPTGIAKLDEMTRGGPRYGDCVGLIGAPDAGKTALVVAVADELSERDDLAVGFYCVDEDEEGIATRLGQRRSYCRDDIENRTDLELLGSHMPPRFYMFDANFALHEVIADMAARAEGLRVALFCDSVQSIAMAMVVRGLSKTLIEATSSVLETLRTTALVRRWLIFFTSEMGRGAYSGVGEQTSTLASGKWSGNIEYAAKVLLGLRSVKGESDLIHVDVAKNKLGPKGEFHLRIDRFRQKFSATDAPHEIASASSEAFADDAPRLVKIILANPGVGSSALRTKAKVAKLGGPEKVNALVEYCEQSGLIVDRPTFAGKREDHHYFVASAAAETGDGT